MPHVIVKLHPGRTEEQKKNLAEAIANNVADILECGKAVVSVAFEEIPAVEWAEQVYRSDILDREETLYVKPGYNPFQK